MGFGSAVLVATGMLSGYVLFPLLLLAVLFSGFKYCFFLPVYSCLVQKLAGSGQVYIFALSVSHEIYSLYMNI